MEDNIKKLTINPYIDNVLNKIIEKHFDNIKVLAILLIGSYAKGNYNSKSDIDLYIIQENIDVKRNYFWPVEKHLFEDIKQKDSNIYNLCFKSICNKNINLAYKNCIELIDKVFLEFVYKIRTYKTFFNN